METRFAVRFAVNAVRGSGNGMAEVSSHVRLDPAVRQGRPKDCSTSSSNPMMQFCL
jgi:hypothetical protein